MAGEIKGIKTGDGITRKVDWSAVANQPFGAYEDVELISEQSVTFSDGEAAVYDCDMTPFIDIELGDACMLNVDGLAHELYATRIVNNPDTGSMTTGLTELTFNRIACGIRVILSFNDNTVRIWFPSDYYVLHPSEYGDGSHAISMSHRKSARIPSNFLGIAMRGDDGELANVEVSRTVFDGDVTFSNATGGEAK